MYIFVASDDFGIWTRGPYRTANSYWTEIGSTDPFLSWIYETWKKNPGNIDRLFLVAHGNAGNLNLGVGVTKQTAQQFSRLAGCFAGGASIELHGCAVGSAAPIPNTEIGATLFPEGAVSNGFGPGYDLLRNLAAATRVMVSAPVHAQFGPSSAHTFSGPVLTVFPDGRYEYGNNTGRACSD